MEISYKKSVNNRCEFARLEYEKLIKSWNITKTGVVIDQITGYRARKLAQAYAIYVHYLYVFNGSRPNGSAGFYNRK